MGAGVRRWQLCEEGYCIRCRIFIPADPERPLCRACEGGDDHEPGRFCLCCGEASTTTPSRPVCGDCHARLYS